MAGLGDILGLAGGLINKGKGAAYYTAVDTSRQQANQALSDEELKRQALTAMLKQYGVNLDYSMGGANTPFKEDKFQVPQPHLNVDPNWNPLNSPEWKNINAGIQANNQATLRTALPRIAGNNLAGVSQKGASLYNLKTGFAQQDATAGRQFAGTQIAGKNAALNTALNTGASGAGQALPAANLSLQAGQVGAQMDQAQQQQQLQSLVGVFRSILSAQDDDTPDARTGGSDPLDLARQIIAQARELTPQQQARDIVGSLGF